MIGEGGSAGPGLSPLTGVPEHVLRCADVRHNRLVHKCSEAFRSGKEWRGVRRGVKFGEVILWLKGGKWITNALPSLKSYQLSLSKALNPQSLQWCCSVASSKIMIVPGSSQVSNWANVTQGYSIKKGVWRYKKLRENDVSLHCWWEGNGNRGRRTHPEVTRGVPHLFHEVSAQLLDAGEVVLHGEGQIHQVVQVYGVVLHTLELHHKALGFTYKEFLQLHVNPKFS